MIQFPCRCGHLFEEPDDSAGSAVQCPQCHLLNDVPTLSDRESIGLDGTYTVNPHSTRPAPDQLEDTLAVFAQARTAGGEELIDLRNFDDELDEIGDVETAERLRRRMRPRYDPETGELIQAIPLADDATKPSAEAAIPIARPAITYEAFGAVGQRSNAQVLLDLVRPLNLLVYFFVLLAHGFLLGSLTVLAMGMFIVLPITAGLVVGIVAHYANVIDEIGVEGQNELPRLLRDLRLHEDIVWPFARVVSACVICFGPAVGALFIPGDASFVASLAVVLAGAGMVFFPAVLLTLQTSGSLANLRPDRILAVIRHSRRKYIAVGVTGAIALLIYGYAMFSLVVRFMDNGPFALDAPAWAAKVLLGLPLLCVGIFMMQAFCWELGLIYRVDGEQFPWVGRYHEREARPPVVRRKPRYVPGTEGR